MKLIKPIVKLFSLLVVLFLLLWTAAAVTFNTDSGQKWLLGYLKNYLNEKTDADVELGSVELSFPLGIKIQKLSIKKNNERLLSVNELSINGISPLIVEGQLICSSLHANGVVIGAALFSNRSESSSETINWQCPLPFYLKIHQLFLDELHAEPDALKNIFKDNPSLIETLSHSFFKIQGYFSNNPSKKTIGTHLLITAEELSGKTYPLQLRIDAQNRQLSLSLHAHHLNWQKSNLNIVAEAALFASSTFDNWDHFLNSSKPSEEIEGSFKIKLHHNTNHSAWSSLDGETTAKGKFYLTTSQLIRLSETELQTPIGIFHAEGSATPTDNDQWNSMNLTCEIQSPHISIQANEIENMHSTFIAKIDSESTECNLTASLSCFDTTCKLGCSGKWVKDNSISISNLSLELPYASILGQGTFSLSTEQFQGFIEAHSSDISAMSFLYPHIEFPKGEITASVTLSQDSTSGKIDCTNLAWKEWKIDRLIGTSDHTSLDPISSGKISFTIDSLSHPSQTIDQITGETTLSSSEELWPFILKGKTSFKENLETSCQGKWKIEQDLSIRGIIENVNGSLGPYPIKFLEPCEFDYKNDDFHLTALHFMLGEGEFTSNFSLSDHHLSSKFHGKQIPSELLYFIYPDIPISGRFTIDGDIDGPLLKPLGQMKLTLHHLQITEEIFKNKPSIEGEILVELGDIGAHIKGKLFGLGTNPLILDGILPVTLLGDKVKVSLNEEAPFQLNISAEGELDPYLHLFYNDTTNITGHAKLALNIKGSLDHPEVEGSIDFQEGTYESYRTGAIYKNINAKIKGNGSKLLLKNFSARDGSEGTINAHGFLDLDPTQGYPFVIDLDSKFISIIDADFATINASGALKLTGNRKQGKLDGNLTVDKASIRMEESLPEQIKTVDVKHINLPIKTPDPILAKGDEAWPLLLNLALKVPGKVDIKGKNLSSEWKGTINITGTPETPLLNGELRIINGRYDIAGKAFDISQGTIHFAGAPEKKTSLYAVATKEIGKIQAEILVKGPLNRLSISFRSNPPLSQREILSYILFNRGTGLISKDEGDFLSQSFMELNTSGDSQPDMLTRLRNKTGLDITSGSNDSGEMSVQVNKYLSDNILISVNKGVNAADDRVALEAKIRKNLKAQAELGVGDESQNKFILMWKKDY